MATNRDYLLKEYEILQNLVEDIDRRKLNLKHWSTTVAITAAGLGLTEKAPPGIYVLMCISSFAFLVLETMYEMAMQRHYKRIMAIEAIPDEQRDQARTLRISENYLEQFYKESKFRAVSRAMVGAHVHLPHSLMFVVGIGLYIYKADALKHLLSGIVR